MNLLDLLKDQVTGTLAKQAGSMLGESEGGIAKALGSGFPAILGSMISKGSTTEGAGSLLKSITSFDGGLMDNIGGMFGGNDTAAAEQLTEKGGGVLDMLLGDKLGGVIDLVSKVGGIGKGSTGSLLKMATPFLMSMVGKQISGKGISGLMDLLKGQKDHVSAAMPAGMGSVLGLGGMFENVGNNLKGAAEETGRAAAGIVGATAGAVGRTANAAGNAGKAAIGTAGNTVQAAKSGTGIFKWLIPVLLVAGLAYILLGTDACSAKTGIDKMKEGTTEMMGDVKESVQAGASKVGGAFSSLFSEVNEAGKKALDGISFAANSAGANMKAFIDGGASEGDGVFRFNNLTFPTGSAMIGESNRAEVDNVAAILKAYPSVNISILGHTDNTGDAAKNKALSQARADAVKARLSSQGIDPSRLTAVGYGDEQPVVGNETEEGRNQNRRVEVKINS